MRSSSKLSFLLVAAAVLTLPLAADARSPKPRSPVGIKKIDLTPRAEPPVRRAVDESACKRDHDCVFLPAVCDRCPPCKPTWRPVGNRAALRRIKSMQARVRCAMVRCRDCAKASNWLGKKPICARGRCWLSGKPLPKGPPRALPRHGEGGSSYQPSGPQQPTRPWSEDRRCKHDRDCVLRPRSPCTCSPCTPTWRRAINRVSLKKLRSRWARMRCKLPVCPSCVATWLGTRAACRKGQCVVK